MSLTIYPHDNANTFADVSMADSVIAEFFPTEAPKWTALDGIHKESLLLQSFMRITTCSGLQIPTDYTSASSDFILAQCYLLMTMIGTSILDIDDNSRAITKEKVGSLEVTYDTKYKVSSHDAPVIFYQLMGRYGCKPTNNNFSQSHIVKV